MKELNKWFGNKGKLITGEKNVWQVAQKWREVFAVNLKQQTGQWQLYRIDWHVFSYKYFPCVRDADAIEKFTSRIGEPFVVFSDAKSLQSEMLQFGADPKRSASGFETFLEDNREYLDLYFFAADGTWTMVYTHEEMCPQFFAEVRK